MFQRRTVTPSAGGVLDLPTPLARLYGTAMVAGIAVIDIPGADAGDLPEDTAAVVGCGPVIAMRPDLDDDERRADVLAMALSVASGMHHRDSGHPGDITAPDGLVVITLDRLIPEPATGRDPRWLLATVTLASDVRPADLDAAGRYRGWAQAAAWVTSATGGPVSLVPVHGALAWSVDEGTAPRD